jgi:hypothetical protein
MSYRRFVICAPLLVAFFGITLARSDSTSWPWPESMDAVQAAGKNHRILYEDEKVRILEVTVAPGEHEARHDHRWPSC